VRPLQFNSRKIWPAAATLLAALLLTACNNGNAPKPTFLSTDISNAGFGADFDLVDHTGKMRTLADFKGKAVVIFFGYTHCPDVCPATMGKLATAMKELGPEEASRVQVLFITVDPERDTAPVLQEYLSAFDPTFLGLYGDDRATKKVAKEFKAIYQKQEGESPGHHTMDHSTGTYIYDTKGKLRLYVSSEKDADVFAHDLSELLRTTS
jgi:protein SCO1/2